MVNFSISAMPVRLQKGADGQISYNADSTQVRYYAKAQTAARMNFDQFAEHVASHNSKYHKGDIQAVIVETMRCLKEELFNGKSIQLSDLGTFCLTLNGPGAPSVSDFNVQENITSIKVRWTPGSAFRNLRKDSDLQLVQVLTRDENADIKKAKKQASPSVKPDKENTENNDDPSTPQQPSARKYTLTVKANNDAYGTVEGGGEYTENASATIKAIAKSGYEFKQWNDGNTAASRMVTVTADKTYTATFSQQQSDEEGTI